MLPLQAIRIALRLGSAILGVERRFLRLNDSEGSAIVVVEDVICPPWTGPGWFLADFHLLTNLVGAGAVLPTCQPASASMTSMSFRRVVSSLNCRVSAAWRPAARACS